MKESFAMRLSETLKKKGMQQQELAQKAGVTEAAVSHYIKGDRIPRASVLARIAEALETSTDYLVNGVETDAQGEINTARRLLARNVHQMSKEEKMAIMSILLGEE